MIQFQRLDPAAKLPTRAHDTDAGFDLYSLEEKVLLPYEVAILCTGIACAIPEGYVGMVCTRSGKAIADGLRVVNAPGIVDSGYRGEIKVILQHIKRNDGWPNGKEFHIRAGDKIAQLVVVPCFTNAIEVDILPSADRGKAGFGSTGR